jgi:hypothetical protein
MLMDKHHSEVQFNVTARDVNTATAGKISIAGKKG